MVKTNGAVAERVKRWAVTGWTALVILAVLTTFVVVLDVPARNAVEYGLTIYNASASRNTLTVMFIIALIGMPLVIAYTAYIYYVFRGKARVEEGGY